MESSIRTADATKDGIDQPTSCEGGVGLSPDSQRIIEKYSASTIPQPPKLDFRLPATLISRPISSPPDTTGFKFAKPSRPTQYFPSGPQPNKISRPAAGSVQRQTPIGVATQETAKNTKPSPRYGEYSVILQ